MFLSRIYQVKYTMTVQCPVPYYSLEINTGSSGTFCCKMQQSQRLNIAIDQFQNLATEDLRSELMQGDKLNDVCRACGGQGHDTRRSRKISQYQAMAWPVDRPRAQLRDLHLALDNVCAASCMACSPNLSTTIDLLTRDHSDQQRQRWFGPAGHRRPQVYKSLDLDLIAQHTDQVELLQIYGGEPLISPLWPQLIDMVNNMPRLHKLALTTGMKQIKPQWVDLLVDLPDKIKIDLVISLDAPLEMNHWIRGCEPGEFLAAWQLIDAVRDRFSRLVVQPVLANYNVWALPELVSAVEEIMGPMEISSTPVWEPAELHASQLPPEIKQRSLDKIALNRSAKDTAWLHRLYKTAQDLMRNRDCVDWSASRQRIHLLPNLRGDHRNIDHWLDQYLH